ncbi:unnamed protein product [Polarella glacialis]|uniref:Calmodulin-lysine N-methyltransferase n=1 Tax=Polarella glacialis TaxID=89957 RepID=A0A813G552_POLGL|nr:unnamed protein product [Polarella glacialis]
MKRPRSSSDENQDGGGEAEETLHSCCSSGCAEAHPVVEGDTSPHLGCCAAGSEEAPRCESSSCCGCHAIPGGQEENEEEEEEQGTWSEVPVPAGGFQAYRRAAEKDPQNAAEEPAGAELVQTRSMLIASDLLPLQLSSLPQHGSGMFGLWGAAPRLVQFIAARYRDRVRGAIVVELGAGSCGAPGLACAALGAAHVVLTDVPWGPVLPMLRRNVSRAREIFPDICPIEVRACVWGCHCPLSGRKIREPDEAVKDKLPPGLDVCSTAEEPLPASVGAPQRRLILGADIAYQPWQYQALLQSICDCRPKSALEQGDKEAARSSVAGGPPPFAEGLSCECLEEPRRGGETKKPKYRCLECGTSRNLEEDPDTRGTFYCTYCWEDFETNEAPKKKKKKKSKKKGEEEEWPEEEEEEVTSKSKKKKKKKEEAWEEPARSKWSSKDKGWEGWAEGGWGEEGTTGTKKKKKKGKESEDYGEGGEKDSKWKSEAWEGEAKPKPKKKSSSSKEDDEWWAANEPAKSSSRSKKSDESDARWKTKDSEDTGGAASSGKPRRSRREKPAGDSSSQWVPKSQH